MKSFPINIITGLSGSGKSTALAAFEDAGYYCVDNLPVALLPQFLKLPMEENSEISGFAFVMDLREKDFISKFPEIFKSLKEKGYPLKICFLEASDKILLQRFSQTRRHHPLSHDKSLFNGICEERKELETLKEHADEIIDTSGYNSHELKFYIFRYTQESIKVKLMRINILSFGYKYGIPYDADIVIDVRFLINPYFVPELKAFNGEDIKVSDYVMNNEETRNFLKKYLDLLDYLIPLYEKEGKAYLTIATGCTGGRHRSVAIARKIYESLNVKRKYLYLTHRDIDR